MSGESRAVAYGSKSIRFAVTRRRRKTLSISVQPSGAVEVLAPLLAPAARIDALVLKRARWIIEKRSRFDHGPKSDRGPRYVSGATHRYLGRQFRLKVHRAIQNKVSISAGRISIASLRPTDTKFVCQQLNEWLDERARKKFLERLESCLNRFPDPDRARPTGMAVREIAKRWGSMTGAGRLILNRRLIQAPAQCIDYVITHELCHRFVSNHGRQFWRKLERVMPDWRERKQRLERDLAALRA